MKTEIELQVLLPNEFYINKEGNMVAEISLKRINMIGDILTQQNEEIERLKTLWEADRQNWACIMYEKEKEIDKLKNNKPDLTNFIKLETAKLNRKREQEKNRLYSENLLLKNDVETLHSIIKEVRELIIKLKEDNNSYYDECLVDNFIRDSLETLDKENI